MQKEFFGDISYRENPFNDDFAVYLFNEGNNFKSYEILGAHKCTLNGKQGYRFAVWAPKARAVHVTGDFNGWEKWQNPMTRLGETGIWQAFVPNIKDGAIYKYFVTPEEGEGFYKSDPYAVYAQVRPDNASVTYDLDGYKWKDKAYMEKRGQEAPYSKPMNIYECHLGSWKMHSDGSFYNYREMADELVPYLKDMGYTHLEIMPIMEYPFDGSWGYQVTGYFAATSRYGTPHDLMYFVDCCHKAGIKVIMDWVPAHFPRDAFGLAKFDGTPTYEYADTRVGEHKEWGTLVFDYSKTEVVSFLISSAMFWADTYHIDGLRVDAVSSMLYLDYAREEYIRNKNGGNENLEAIEFLRRLNEAMFNQFPNFLMIAEESTAWPMVTKPRDVGGLGFNYKWNMGWMNDNLRYMSMDPYFRSGNHSLLTFSMMYAFSENYILPLSHDEVVHGKASLIGKMSALYDGKFDSFRAFLGYYMAHPGKKLMFMGGEIAQFLEWRFYEGLEWHLLEDYHHSRFHEYVKNLNHFYKDNKPFWEIEDSWDGFEWINANDNEKSIVSFMRKGRAKGSEVIVVSNFTPVEYKEYSIGVSRAGEYEEVFSSNRDIYGGTGSGNPVPVKAKKYKYDCDGRPYTLTICVPPMTTMYFKRKAAKRNTTKK
ncbi:MAG: 1,4-alpha-glucan branching protein GlgB [Clostridia bacterium]|nr:1,4-alpha-glucan branching protein GlgB [Clostridia bacterium]